MRIGMSFEILDFRGVFELRRALPLFAEAAEEAELGGSDFDHIAAGVERTHQETAEN